MHIFLLWFVAAVLVGICAASRGRSAVAWSLLSFLISPILALLFLLAVGVKRPRSAGDPLAAMKEMMAAATKAEQIAAAELEEAARKATYGKRPGIALVLVILALLGAAIAVMPILRALQHPAPVERMSSSPDRTLIEAPDPSAAWAQKYLDGAMATIRLVPLGK